MSAILSSVACNLDHDILSACYPLFEAERIEAIEWSFDALHKVEQVPSWFTELLSVFSSGQRLVGHGVYFSLFSGRWLPEQQQWLDKLSQLCLQFNFDHISEHFGFLTGRDFHQGAPLTIPYSETTLQIGRDRLARIYDACQCPVGLENLAFSYTPQEVKRHGDFLEKLVEPVNGFIILDLHNLYCQSHNFSIPAVELMAMHPLHRVREIHISGGSWESNDLKPEGKIRRDTHDDAVPAEVFALLEYAMDHCPQLKYVVLEQLGTALRTEERREQFRQDFLRMQSMVREQNLKRSVYEVNTFLPYRTPLLQDIAEDELLYTQQMELSDILETSASLAEARNKLRSSSLQGTSWHPESWDDGMLETAIKIAQKWK